MRNTSWTGLRILLLGLSVTMAASLFPASAVADDVGYTVSGMREAAPVRCYSPSGFIGFAEALAWKARRNGLDYASFNNPVTTTPTSLRSLDYDWQGGVRGGIGYRFASGWEAQWNYTHYRTSDSDSIDTAAVPNNALLSTRSVLDVEMTEVGASSSLNYNVHDLEVGKRFCLDCKSDMRLFAGFRWADIDQDFDSTYAYQDLFSRTITGEIANPINMQGYGLRAGMQGRWKWGRGFSLFAQGAGSVLVGEFKTRQYEEDTDTGVLINFQDSYSQAVPVLEAAAGLAWQRGPWEVSGGYELNSWFNMASLNRASYDMILDGFFLRASFCR